MERREGRMTLDDVKIGGLFIFDNPNMRDVYKKKKRLDDEWCIVGLPDAYDEFAARRDSRVVSYDQDLTANAQTRKA